MDKISPLLQLPEELRRVIYYWILIHVSAAVMGTNIPPSRKEMLGDGIFNVLHICRQVRDEALRVFNELVRFRVDLPIYRVPMSHDTFTGLRSMAFRGSEMSTGVQDLRKRWPEVRSVHIFFRPSTTTNFGTLKDFAACNHICCNDDFKSLLLNALFFREDKSDDRWISAFKAGGKAELEGRKDLEITLVMRWEAGSGDKNTSRTLTGLISTRDFDLRLKDNTAFEVAFKQLGINEDEDCQLVELDDRLNQYFIHQWRAPRLDSAAGPGQPVAGGASS